MQGTDVNKLNSIQRLNLIRQGEAALAKRGQDPVIHYQLALLHRANGSMKNATEHLKKVIKVNKKDKDALAQLADIYAQNKEYVQARKYVRRLVEAYPRDELSLIFQAEFLEKAGQAQQAKAVWEKITKLFPNNPENFHSLAVCLRQLGDWEEAKRLHTKVLELDPLHPASLYMLATAGNRTDEEAKRLIASINKSILVMREDDHPSNEANLHYAGGKLHTELGEIAEAMEHYRQANSLRDETPWHRLQQPFDNIKAGYLRDVIKEKASYGSEDASPVFVLGMPRSGTTLTESLLGSHSKVIAGDEQPFIGQISAKIGTTTGKTDSFARLVRGIDEPSIRSMAQDYLDATEELRKGHQYFTDKMPHNFLNIGLIRILFPNAKIIHCRRHPIDNCLSLYTNSMNEFHNGYKVNLKTLGLYYRQYLQLMEHWRREIPGGFHEVYYEDMVANTELNARAMIDYLDLEWEDGVLARENSQKSVRTLSVWQVRQPVYTSSAGRWKKFEPYLGPLIDSLGSSVEAYENELQALNPEKSE